MLSADQCVHAVEASTVSILGAMTADPFTLGDFGGRPMMSKKLNACVMRRFCQVYGVYWPLTTSRQRTLLSSRCARYVVCNRCTQICSGEAYRG